MRGVSFEAERSLVADATPLRWQRERGLGSGATIQVASVSARAVREVVTTTSDFTGSGYGRGSVSARNPAAKSCASSGRLLAVVSTSVGVQRQEGNDVGDGERLREGSKALKGRTPRADLA
jgi:hypothetical protein